MNKNSLKKILQGHKIRIAMRIMLILSILFLIICGRAFSRTKGLVDSVLDEYVNDLPGSQPDDNICIEISPLIFILFFVSNLVVIRKFSKFDLIIGNATVFFQFIFLLAIESGSILKTILRGNFILLIWFILYILVFVEINFFYFYERKQEELEMLKAIQKEPVHE